MARLHFIGSLKEVNAHVHLEVHVIEDVRLSWKKIKKSYMLHFSTGMGNCCSAVALHVSLSFPKIKFRPNTGNLSAATKSCENWPELV